MAVPKKRHSKSKVGRRRMHLYLKETPLVKCTNCGEMRLPHTVCPFCGFYKGREVLKIEKKEKKKKKKEKEK
jgi:large subunit ribosomal protein L32